MAAIGTALVAGGGIAGMSAAISLARAGVAVTLIDKDPHWRVYGAGITITGPTLRVMERLGVLDGVLADGWTADGILACDAAGNVVSEIDTAHAANGIPGAGGIMRPVLHKLLQAQVRKAGVTVVLGTAVVRTCETEVILDDGARGAFDLVVGADGIFSDMRAMAFPEVGAPRYVGQLCWRLMCERHPQIDRRTYFLGGPVKLGMNPVAPDRMYMFLLEPSAEMEIIPDAVLPGRLSGLMDGFGGIVADVRQAVNAESAIVVRPLETIFVPEVWHRGNVLLIGDAAHATTPQLASGAGMAMEDGVVLGEVIGDSATLAEALDAFMARRLSRCALVVEKSLELGRLERAGTAPVEQIRVVEEALAALNGPY